jgi:hypothetical protein
MEENKKMNHWKKLSILLFIVCLILLGMFIYNNTFPVWKSHVAMEGYKIGFREGSENWNNVVISSVNNGKIPILINNTIQQISIKNFCGGLRENE